MRLMKTFKEKTNFNKAFWGWFKRSKVVDERGDPLVVYHGSFTNWHDDPEAQFSFDKFSSATDTGDVGRGFYFTDSKIEAQAYGRFVNSFYLSIQFPFIFGEEYYKEIQIAMEKLRNSENPGVLPTVKNLSDLFENIGIDVPVLEKGKRSFMNVYEFVEKVGKEEFYKGMLKLGYDGVYWMGEWVAYYPEQIMHTKEALL